MDRQALNKKLAEWAGWTQEFRIYSMCWVNPDGNGHDFQQPNFTESLNVCFMWFKPKFRSMACGSLYEDNWKGAWAKVIAHNGESAWVREPDIDPALALCLAIEKLLDSRRELFAETTYPEPLHTYEGDNLG